MSLRDLSNNELWDRYKEALEAWAQEPTDYAKKRTLDAAEDECMRRILEASRKPLGLEVRCD